MIDAPTLSRLHDLIRREERSFLQYVAEAEPWLRPADRPAFAQLRRWAADEREAVAALARVLQQHRQPLPQLGSFPMAFTTFNFVALPTLLPRLVASQEQTLADLQKDIDALSAEADVRTALEALRDRKQKHWQQLPTLVETPRQAAS